MRVRVVLLAATLVAATVGATAARAHHNDWALPLLGGAVGGYALKSVLGAREGKAQPAHAAPAAAPAPAVQPASSTASVESRLNELDRLAANGYITKEEYQQRRQAILDGL